MEKAERIQHFLPVADLGQGEASWFPQDVLAQFGVLENPAAAASRDPADPPGQLLPFLDLGRRVVRGRTRGMDLLAIATRESRSLLTLSDDATPLRARWTEFVVRAAIARALNDEVRTIAKERSRIELEPFAQPDGLRRFSSDEAFFQAVATEFHNRVSEHLLSRLNRGQPLDTVRFIGWVDDAMGRSYKAALRKFDPTNVPASRRKTVSADSRHQPMRRGAATLDPRSTDAPHFTALARAAYGGDLPISGHSERVVRDLVRLVGATKGQAASLKSCVHDLTPTARWSFKTIGGTADQADLGLAN